MWASTLFTDGSTTLQWSVALSACGIAAVMDLSSRRIPNWLTGPLVLSGLAYATAIGGLSGLADGMTAMIALALPYVLLFLFARGGAGDAKLMGGIGAWLGLIHGSAALVGVATAGFVMAIGWAVFQRQTRAVIGNLAGIATGAMLAVCTRTKLGEALRSAADPDEMARMPYGVAIFLGVCLSGLGMQLWLS